MSDFITEIRKIPTNRLLHILSNISIMMFEKLVHQISLPIELTINGFNKSGSVLLTGWDIHSIAFHSVINSNDYRNSRKALSLPELISLYRIYDNDHSAADAISKSDFNGVFRIMMNASLIFIEHF